MKAAVLGCTGYTGMILLRILGSHPEVATIIPVSSSRAGDQVLQVDPGLASLHQKTEATGGACVTLEEAAKLGPDVVFSALPHLESARLCEPFLGNTVVIDLSADFRIKDPQLFRKSYGSPPPRADLLRESVYGLSEVYRDQLSTADIIANPGCYPTATLLPILPLAEANLLEGPVIVNALSGISGAGRKTKTMLLYAERTENTCAYSPGTTHRHTGEISQELWRKNPDLKVLFTPHLVPLKRGMAVTTTVQLKEGTDDSAVRTALEQAYSRTPFVRLVPDRLPETRDVWGSNRCDIAWHTEGAMLMLFSVIDNLVKGASGQAVQNMNIRFGIDETRGLTIHGEV